MSEALTALQARFDSGEIWDAFCILRARLRYLEEREAVHAAAKVRKLEAQRQRRQAVYAAREPRYCLVCGTELEGRSTRRTCSDYCRQILSREQRATHNA